MNTYYTRRQDTIAIVSFREEKELRVEGARLERRDRVQMLMDKLCWKVPGFPSLVAGTLEAVFIPNWRRRDFDWVDRRMAKGLCGQAARCPECGRIVRRSDMARTGPNQLWFPATHFKCREKAADAIFARFLEEERVRDEVREIRRQERILKCIRKLASLMDEPMTYAQAASVLPWRVSPNALRRMCQRGKLNSTTIGGERRLRGRDLLTIVKSWADTGRPPCRARAKKQGAFTKREPCQTQS